MKVQQSNVGYVEEELRGQLLSLGMSYYLMAQDFNAKFGGRHSQVPPPTTVKWRTIAQENHIMPYSTAMHSHP